MCPRFDSGRRHHLQRHQMRECMDILITVIHILVALFMILVVLVQGGNQGGVGAAFGGGNTQGVFGASGATSFLGKLTYAAAFIFMITSISLVVLQGGNRIGLSHKLEQQQPTTPAEPETTPDGTQE